MSSARFVSSKCNESRDVPSFRFLSFSWACRVGQSKKIIDKSKYDPWAQSQRTELIKHNGRDVMIKNLE
jgi:hypothetical protein